MFMTCSHVEVKWEITSCDLHLWCNFYCYSHNRIFQRS